MGPIRTGGKRLIERCKGGSVDILRLIALARYIEDDVHADEVHSDGVGYSCRLVINDPYDHGPWLGRGAVRRVATRVAAGAEDVELREGLPGPRRQNDVAECAGRHDDARSEGDCHALLECVAFLRCRHLKANREG